MCLVCPEEHIQSVTQSFLCLLVEGQRKAGVVEEERAWARCWGEGLYVLSVRVYREVGCDFNETLVVSGVKVVSSICLFLRLSHSTSHISKHFLFLSRWFKSLIFPTIVFLSQSFASLTDLTDFYSLSLPSVQTSLLNGLRTQVRICPSCI